MKLNKALIVFAIGISGIFVFYRVCSGVMFGNMKGSGEKVKEAQIMSAKAASTFFQAAATAFEMFSTIELNALSANPSFDDITRHAENSLELLDKALAQFELITKMEDDLETITDDMRKQNDYELIFYEATTQFDNKFKEEFIKIAIERGASGLLEICINSIKEIRSPESPMGKVYSMVRQKRIPEAQTLWAASAQWERVFQIGRITSSFFTIREKE